MTISRAICVVAVSLFACLPLPALAQEKPEEKKETPKDSNLKSLGFGMGLGFRWNVLKPDVVEEAELDANGIVRVKKRANTHTAITLESHYLVRKSRKWGVGPFVAVEASSDTVISSVGAGLLLAWKVNDEGRGFGLGIGYSAQPNTKVLGPEFVEGEAAPKGPDGKPLAVRLQERDKGAIQALFSVVF